MRTAPAPLSVAVHPDQYPALSALLDGADGDLLRSELELLLGHPLKKRAPRRHVKRIARLRSPSKRYDEVVLIKDLSASGVRLLVQGDLPLDLRDMMEMDLVVKLPQGRRVLPISVVRLCGRDGQHLDLGCRFMDAEAELDELVQEIRSHMFTD